MENIRCTSCGRGISDEDIPRGMSIKQFLKYRKKCLQCYQKFCSGLGIPLIVISFLFFLGWLRIILNSSSAVADFLTTGIALPGNGASTLLVFQEIINNIGLTVASFQALFLFGWLAVKEGIAGKRYILVHLWDCLVLLPSIVILITLYFISASI